jgi:diacylglycerol O-acyltransferase / wax synthase
MMTTTGRAPLAPPRVSGADESYLLAEDLLGMSAPIQFLWVFDDDPGEQPVDHLRDALAAGSLNRAVRRTRVPAARHRWVRSTVPPATVAATPIGDDEVGSWADDRLRAADLRPVDGAGWRLESAVTGDGRRVVSLLLSHMIADGQGVYRALAAAHSGVPTSLPGADPESRFREIREDIADGGRQLVAAGSSLRKLFRQARRGRRAAAPPPAASRSRPGELPTPRGGPDTTLAIVDIDRQAWHARAREHNGTANSLFTALLAGIVQRSGLPVPGDLRVCIAVDQRAGDPDDRANASGGVWIRVPDPVEPTMRLDGIRALSKRAFIEYAESGADQTADNLAPIVRLLPRRLVAKMMASIPGPDTTVSNLGVAPRESLEIGGVTASSFAIRAIMQGMPADRRRRQGPALAAWAVEYGDRVTLTFFGIHPDHFGDTELLRKLIDDELAGWELDHGFW